jgi:hypothetical protein
MRAPRLPVTPSPTRPIPERKAEAAPSSPARFAAAVALGLVFIAAVNVAVRNAELVTGRYVAGGVPPIAAFGALLILLGLRAPLRRIGLDVTRDQLLIVYSMVALGTFLSGAYAVRAFLPHLVSLQYWGRSRPELARFAPYLPSWLAPSDAAAIRDYFRGNHGRGVPWALWLGPLAAWLAFWCALFGAAGCLMLLFRRQWLQHERLSFPLLTLPLALTTGGLRFGHRPLLRDPLLWLGIGLAVLFDGLNIGHALRPTLPAPGFYFRLTDISDRPWTPFNSITLFFMLEAIGFGYFVPLEISFSMWFFYLLEKLFAVSALAAGNDTPGLPFLQQQSAGAYLAVGALLLFGARRHLTSLWRRAFHQSSRTASRQDREARFAWIGLGTCVGFMLWFGARAGLSLGLALPYAALLGCFVLVYARLRAETGVPFEFIYPYGLPRELLTQGLAATGLLATTSPRSLTILSLLAWLSRHHAGNATAAYQIEALKLAEVGQIARRRLIIALTAAFVFAMVCAFWSHLSAYYDLGSNVAGGGRHRPGRVPLAAGAARVPRDGAAGAVPARGRYRASRLRRRGRGDGAPADRPPPRLARQSVPSPGLHPRHRLRRRHAVRLPAVRRLAGQMAAPPCGRALSLPGRHAVLHRPHRRPLHPGRHPLAAHQPPDRPRRGGRLSALLWIACEGRAVCRVLRAA